MSRLDVNAIRHTAGSSDNISLDSSGRLLVGTSSAPTISPGSEPLLVVEGSSAADTEPGQICLARGNTAANLASGNGIGYVLFTDSQGGTFANIGAQADATPGASDYPGRLVFSTSADGASSPTERMRLDSSGNLRFNSGFGSVATAYGCRAWVNFQGTGTVAIRASGNVSSITDNGTGDYTANFTNSMPDDDYATVGSNIGTSTSYFSFIASDGSNSDVATGSVRFSTRNSNSSSYDQDVISIAVFR